MDWATIIEVLSALYDFAGEFFRNFGFVISAAVVWFVYRKNARTAGRRASFDLIERTESTEFYQTASKTFHKYVREKNLSDLHEPNSGDGHVDRLTVFKFLNLYELISNAIIQGYLDEDIYRRFMQSNFLIDWNTSAEFIQRERWKYDEETGTWTYKERLYEWFQTLANKWGAERGVEVITISREYSGPPERPVGIGDQQFLTPVKKQKLFNRSKQRF